SAESSLTGTTVASPFDRRPSAIASATRWVLPYIDSYTTSAFMRASSRSLARQYEQPSPPTRAESPRPSRLSDRDVEPHAEAIVARQVAHCDIVAGREVRDEDLGLVRGQAVAAVEHARHALG